MQQIATMPNTTSPGHTAMSSADSWGFALALLRRLGMPPGVVPVQISITLSTGHPVSVPIFPPSGPPVAEASAFVPCAAQLRILRACRDAAKTATQLKLAEPNLYRTPGGIWELQEHGYVDRSESGRWVCTERGREFVDSMGEG